MTGRAGRGTFCDLTERQLFAPWCRFTLHDVREERHRHVFQIFELHPPPIDGGQDQIGARYAAG